MPFLYFGYTRFLFVPGIGDDSQRIQDLLFTRRNNIERENNTVAWMKRISTVEFPFIIPKTLPTCREQIVISLLVFYIKKGTGWAPSHRIGFSHSWTDNSNQPQILPTNEMIKKQKLKQTLY